VLIYVDTNALIAATEGTDQVAELVRSLLATAASGAAFATSELTLGELLVVPLRVGDVGRIKNVHRLFEQSDQLQVMAINRQIVVAAADLRAVHASLKWPDSIHLATAVSSGCRLFLSNDLRLPPLPELTFIRLEPAPLSAAITEATRAD